MKQIILALALLPGCSLLFQDAAPGEVGPDAGVNIAPDADPRAGLASNHLGVYSVAFELDAVCSTTQFAADTLDITPEGLTFKSSACATHADTFVATEVIVVNALSVGPLELWNCAETIRYEVAPFILTFADAEGLAAIQADQFIPPQTNVICAGEYTLRATK